MVPFTSSAGWQISGYITLIVLIRGNEREGGKKGEGERSKILYIFLLLLIFRPNHLLEAHVSGHMVKRELTQEGEVSY